MDEDSPWGDVPSSRSHSATRETAQVTAPTPTEEDVTPTPAQAVPAASPAKPKPSRGARNTRRFGTQSTTLEALDDTLGPLGPLNASGPPAEEPPAPPQKEMPSPTSAQAAGRLNKPLSVRSNKSSLRGMMESVNLDGEDDAAMADRGLGPRVPPPVAPHSERGTNRVTPGGVSVEQAAKPTFDITVGDPHKVGDLTSSHTVYQVRTKTSSKAYRNPEFAVSRRYRDFLWLYNQMHSNNPGVVVPPPPEKQAVGRFDQNFVESRRAALERMLNKIALHPILQHDGDLKLFLESDAFNVDIKHKERKDVGLPESKGGIMSSIGLSVGSSTKFIEHDDWFHDRRIYLDALEVQLKGLLKSIDAVVAQRKSLAESCSDFSTSLHALAMVELSPSLSGPLDGLSDVQLRIRDLYDRQAQQDVLTLGIVIDEYIRLISSVKLAFTQRQKAFHAWHAAESALGKLKQNHDKLLRAGRTQQDRLGQMQADVSDAERRVHQARLLFEDMGRLMRGELDRFEREKVEDFKSGVETFLESAVEAQKELIEIWETYLMQLDADEDGSPLYGSHVPQQPQSGLAQQQQDGEETVLPHDDAQEDDGGASNGPAVASGAAEGFNGHADDGAASRSPAHDDDDGGEEAR